MNRYPITEPPPYPDLASHMPVLWTVLEILHPLSIYEFGAGMYSTALLSSWGMVTRDPGKYCPEGLCSSLSTGENDSRWLPSPSYKHHTVKNVSDTLDSMTKSVTVDGLAFVDCEANLRAGLISGILDRTDCSTLVVHDTEPIAERAYNMRGAIMRWPYGMTVKCPFHHIDTTVLSREPMSDNLRHALKSLTSNPAGHRFAWHMLALHMKANGILDIG